MDSSFLITSLLVIFLVIGAVSLIFEFSAFSVNNKELFKSLTDFCFEKGYEEYVGALDKGTCIRAKGDYIEEISVSCRYTQTLGFPLPVVYTKINGCYLSRR